MDRYDERRLEMVQRDLVRRGIADMRVLSAMAKVPRHLFVPPHLVDRAYDDEALGLSEGQTISQPYIVALMAEALLLAAWHRVLEIGTGSGYAAAIAAELCQTVYTVERRPALAEAAAKTLAELGYTNVHVRVGDGTLGWPEEAPFDAIAVTAGGERTPAPLLAQLKPKCPMVMPVGRDDQTLVRLIDGRREELIAVRFVPLIGAEA
jgi:protein-L-isoaspartate(D-aspartate) O-methyltransferase